MSSSVAWYAHRLRGMSAGEVAGRVGDLARRARWASRHVRPGDHWPDLTGARAGRSFASPLVRDGVPVAGVARDSLVDAARGVLEGRWTVLGTRCPTIADPDWFLDPVSGRRAPQRRLAFRVDHRDESVTGNVKVVWEISRHHHLTVLAAAWWLTGEDAYAEAVDRQLRSWWRENPFLSGVHWTSGIELGVRLISWVWIRRLLADWPGVGALFDDNDDALRQIRWHQEFLAAFPSRGSSANNHAVAEAAGLFTSASAFAWFDESPRWQRLARHRLHRALVENTFASGINRELATDYHRFVADLGLVSIAEGCAAGLPPDDEIVALLTRMLDGAAAVVDVDGRPPRQGDGDEGRALVVDGPGTDPWAILQATGDAMLGRQPWWPEVVPSVAGAALPAISGRLRSASPRPLARPAAFDDAGVTVLTTELGAGPEIWCRCDGGPHGFGSIAAHAHADALAVEVRYAGVEVLVDPGTYCYHDQPQWRSYFRSTLAHNTVEVDGRSQAVEAGAFLWSTRPTTTVVEADLGATVATWTAEHDGYQRLADPVRHRRQVRLDHERRSLTITDHLSATGAHTVRLPLHLGPDVAVTVEGGRACLRWGADDLQDVAYVDLPPALTWTLHEGEVSPPLGWYSPRFGIRVPSPTLVGEGRTRGDFTARVVLRFPKGSSQSPARRTPAEIRSSTSAGIGGADG
ncbi:heparinase II/III family protein [Mumia sp. zg.B21]|uniref:alginate lyase family protein n=1 Tax=Mumia sp. zg.B21 TaxID=2855447 RepID=UPI001C6EE820|nr:alginate lyase family protein [Mumia sp. zg.B21]MBW9210779.1 heparinase II/III family protein [Mumia sp. zg.B21]